MIKITLIMWIVTILLDRFIKLQRDAMTKEEKVKIYFTKKLPILAAVTIILYFLSFIASIILTVITIITW